MDRHIYESLTPMEKACLRLAHHERKAEQIAHELGIKPSTVNTHVFSARRKLGGPSRLSAADQLRAHEAALLAAETERLKSVVSTADVGGGSAAQIPPQPLPKQTLRMAETTAFQQHGGHPADVRERRSVFVFDDDMAGASGGKEGPGNEFLRRVRLILAIALLAALVTIAAPAIYDSAAERVANSLERPHLK